MQDFSVNPDVGQLLSCNVLTAFGIKRVVWAHLTRVENVRQMDNPSSDHQLDMTARYEGHIQLCWSWGSS